LKFFSHAFALFKFWVSLNFCAPASQGEFVTWAKLSAIKANLAIELTFDECLKTVKVSRSCCTSLADAAPDCDHVLSC